MTMKDMICDVCRKRPAIGVASTSIPYSVAYCPECARMSADPESVFEYFLEMADGDATKVGEGFVTYKDGKYVTFHQWAANHVCAPPSDPADDGDFQTP